MGRDATRCDVAAYAVGGPACTIKTVEAITNIRINHFVVVDFNGFKNMVDALGGVPVCVPEEVNDNIGHIYLPAGSYEVKGQQALSYNAGTDKYENLIAAGVIVISTGGGGG